MKVLQSEWLKAPGTYSKQAFAAGEDLVVVGDAGQTQMVISQQRDALDEYDALERQLLSDAVRLLRHAEDVMTGSQSLSWVAARDALLARIRRHRRSGAN